MGNLGRIGENMELKALPQLIGIDQEMDEVVLRESRNRSESLSLIVGESLFQLVRTKRRKNEQGASTVHSLCLRRDSIEGFVHNRFDIIRAFRWPLILTCLFSFISSSLISITWTAPFELGIALFLFSSGLLLFRLGKPHQLVFITNNSKQSLFFFSFRSKKTEIIMKEIDRIMALFLINGKIDLSQINVNIGRIGDSTTTVNDSVVMNNSNSEDLIPSLDEIYPNSEFEEIDDKKRR